MTYWTQVTTDGGFTKRDHSKIFVFDKVWMSQGFEVGGVARTDLLNSTDGQGFTLVDSTVPYGNYAPICPHQGWIYIVDSVLRKTQDGINFTTVSTTGTAPGLINNAELRSMNGKLWLVVEDGVHCIDPDNPVWSFEAAPWPTFQLYSHYSIVFRNRLWVIAGAKTGSNGEAGYPALTSLNTVWSTDDPADSAKWVQHPDAPFAPRMWPAVAVMGPYMYVTGGYNNVAGGSSNFNDIWRTDGETWTQLSPSTNYTARHAPSLYNFNGNLYLAAGNTNTGTSTQKDVWKLTLEGDDMVDFAPVMYDVVAGKLYYDNGSGPVEIELGEPDPGSGESANSGPVKLLMHCNGTDGATTTADSSVSTHAITLSGGAQLDTAQFKFGASSILFNGTSAYATIANTSDFTFGTGDFTIEAFIRLNAGSKTQLVYDGRPLSTAGYYPTIYVSSANKLIYYTNSAIRITGTTNITTGAWHHIAYCRSGTTGRLFLNGVLEGSWTDSGTYLGSTSRPVLGASGDDLAGGWLDGWIDEVRIQKGNASYTAAFTPPSTEF